MTLFAEAQVEAWLAAAGMVATFLTTAAAAYVVIRRHLRANRKEESEAARDERKASSEEQKQARRDAADEAWDVVDRLNNAYDEMRRRVEALERDRDAERDARSRCESEHAATKAILRIVLLWGKQGGRGRMPMTKEIEDLLREGSGPHNPLPPGEQP